MVSQPNQPEKLKVFISTCESTCGEFGKNLGSTAWITLVEKKGALCLAYADLEPTRLSMRMPKRIKLHQ